MSITFAYLNDRLLTIWELKRIGFPQVDIAAKLGVSRQAVNKALDEAIEKVSRALTEQALISKIEIQNLDPATGMVTGWSREFGVKAVITLNRKDGMQVWYEHEADCGRCMRYYACQNYLFNSAKERGIKLTKEQKHQPPSKLAQRIFGLDGKN
jgi:hypothetical protein